LVQQVEGDEWAEHDKRGGSYTLTLLLVAYQQFKQDPMYLGETFDAQLFDHAGVVYGKEGVSRWVVRSETLCLDGSSTHEAKREQAKALGFAVLM
jgi:hypothetical protein